MAGVPPRADGRFEAIPKALRKASALQTQTIELNEAFACQALAVIAGVGLDPAR